MLVQKGEVKLLDFGMAVEARTEAGLAGTIEYMAPELFLGQPPSRATDLYSVGVLAYQLLTGEFPYSRDSMTQMLHMILGTRSDLTIPSSVREMLDHYPARSLAPSSIPAAGSSVAALEHADAEVDGWRSKVSGPIGEVIRRLVAKRHEDRYADAHIVLHDLANAISNELPIETAATRESFLQATALAGRQSEMQVLSAALNRANARQGSAFLIGGESGVGKSRLLSELRTLALVLGFWGVQGQSTTDAGIYYQEWRPLLRGLGLRTELSDTQIGVFQEVVGDLGALLGRTPPALPTVAPEAAKQRLVQNLAEVLKGLRKPLLLLLEDLQWARSESLELLAKLLELLADLPVLIIGTYRTEEAPALPMKLEKMQSLRLERLNREGVAQLSESILGEAGRQPALVSYLEQQTEGNVFFLIEIMRALAEDAGELQRIGGGALPETILTQGIERLAERRLERVSPGYREWLHLAAIAGRQLDLRVLQKAASHSDSRPLLIECANAGIIESIGSSWQFSHDKLRETLLAKLNANAKEILHRRIAETMDDVYEPEERSAKSATLAYHYSKARIPDRALNYYIEAGHQAGKLGLLSESRKHYQNALEMIVQLPESPENVRRRIDLLLMLMQSSLVSDSLEALLGRAKEVDALLTKLESTEESCEQDRLRRLRLEYYTGRVYFYVGKAQEALRIYKQVMAKAQEFDDPELNAMPAAAIGMGVMVQGYLGTAYPTLAKAIEGLQRMGDAAELVRCQTYMTISLTSRGSYREGKAMFEQARLRAIELNQWQMQILAKLMWIIAHRCCMDWPFLVAQAPPLADEIGRLGEKTYAVIALQLAAWGHGQLGNREEYLQAKDKAQELIRALGGNILVSDWWAAAEAEEQNALGHPQEALKRAQEVIATSRVVPRPLSWAVAERAMAVALGRLGESMDEVANHFQESLQACTLGGLLLDAAQTEFFWGRTCLERGDRAAAQLHLGRALAQFETSGCDYACGETRSLLHECASQ